MRPSKELGSAAGLRTKPSCRKACHHGVGDKTHRGEAAVGARPLLVSRPGMLGKRKRSNATRALGSREGRAGGDRGPASRGLETDVKQENRFRSECERHGLAAAWRTEKGVGPDAGSSPGQI